MPLEELRRYQPVLNEPADFDAFWAAALEQAARYPLDARFEEKSTFTLG